MPAVKFSYYDTNDNTYKTLTTEEYTVHVARGANDNEPVVVSGGNYTNKEDIQTLGSDIRYIDTKEPKPLSNARGLSGLWWLWYLVPLALSIVLFILFRKQIRDNSDITRVRYKKAGKVAQKRLKKAKKLLATDNDAAFYEEIERASWTYLSDRLSIPQADLTKENISGILRSKNTAEQLIAEVNNVLSTAEFARYAPATDHTMDDLYQATTNLINHLEDQKI